jgi:hypothetical protein
MKENMCPRCSANLTSGYCEYCGWNKPISIESKVLTINGILCDLTVTKDSCTFNPKIGSSTIIKTSDISTITLSQAPIVGTGNLSIQAFTGITQEVTFLPTQNLAVSDIASYLRQFVPNVQFNESVAVDNSNNMSGVTCPKCNSKNTQNTSSASRRFSIWKLIVAAILISAGIGSFSAGPVFSLILIGGAGVLAASGFGIIGKKKTDLFCMDCRKKFKI